MTLTSVIDGLAHLVADDESSMPSALESGRYVAACGHLVAPTPLVEPSGPRCGQCADRARLAHLAAP